ncbi:MAG: YggT family protein [Pseudomonadota bacterium]
MSILIELIDWCASAFACMLILRIYFSYHQVSFSHPLGNLILRFTSPVLRPLRRVIPHNWNWFGVDWTLIFVALLFFWGWHGLMFLLEHASPWGYFWPPLAWLATLANSVLGLVHGLSGMLLWMVCLHIVLSWVSNAPVDWLQQAVQPWLAPLQKVLPSLYGLDFSPLALIIALKVATHVLEETMRISPPRGLHAFLSSSPF